MNSITTLIRHLLTFLAGIGTMLYKSGLIDASGVEAANQAGEKLIDPLTVIAGLVAVVAVRAAMTLLGKIFPDLSAKLNGKVAGGLPMLWVYVTAAGFMGSLPSCSPGQLAAARALPIRIGVQGPHAAASYSSKGGLAVDYVIREEK